MRLPRTLKSKRGVALENAVLFMVVIFLLCTLLITIALLMNHQLRIDNVMLLQDVEIEQVGEDYLASLKEGTEFLDYYLNYDYALNGNVLTVWRKTDENKSVVLYVEAEIAADGQLRVLQWRYSLPIETE